MALIGSIEVLEGTTIHPIWSVDRNDWVPLVDLAEGESLQGLDGLAVVLSITLSRVYQPVYNLEVHGEHVYQVGEMGVLVHNSTDDCLNLLSSTQRKTYSSLQNNITEHYRKLADYVANPEAFDNLGILKNAPNAQVRQSIIDGRIRHLTQEIRNWENQLARMISGG
ncbi:polymorphic toxin-type HINT domain-containing protein [Pirellulaceae bacterium SH501]